MLSFIIGVILRLVNLLFAFWPGLANVTAGFAGALQTIFGAALSWNWILPLTDSMQLIVRAIQFEFAIVLVWFGKWIVEMIRGK